jgi:hypothetical protein
METTDDSKNFFKYVFNFDDASKSDMLNIIQYTLIAIIPVVSLNKAMQKYVPESDDRKGSIELLAEIILQVVGMFIGLLLIHRIITFVPTYSGMNYPDFNIVFIILAVLMITLSLQTKLGEKVSVLTDRLSELWDGKPSGKKGGKNNNNNNNNNNNSSVKVSQPISGQNNYSMSSNQNMSSGSGYSDGTSINSLPTETQQLPDYNNMVRNDSTPLQNAETPGDMAESFVPMAASEFLGGGFGSSW